MIAGKPFMKLKLIATIAALVAIPAVAYAQQGQSNVSKPTKADVQNVVKVVTADNAKTQAETRFPQLRNRDRYTQ